MGTHDVPYVWTAADEAIRNAAADPAKKKELRPCGGGFAQCLEGFDKKTEKTVHTCFVTPYGIRAERVAQRKVGTKADVDIALSHNGQPGLAARFGAALPWYPIAPAPTQKGTWSKDFPSDGATDLGGLIALLSKHPLLYPEWMYGDVKAAAKMLFDYWENTEWRYAVVSKGFTWETYSKRPEKIPLEANGARIKVVRMAQVVVKLAVPPGLPPLSTVSNKLMDQMDGYIDELYACARQVNGLLQLTEKSLQARMQPLMQLNALRELAAATGGATGEAIRGKLDEILESAHDGMVALPTRMNATLEDFIDSFQNKRSLAMNAGAALAEESAKLERLLHQKNGADAKLCTEWGTRGLPDWTATQESALGVPRVKEQFEKLGDAMSHAVVAFCNTRPTEDPARMLEHLKATADVHADTMAKVKGETPLAVVLSLVGKGASLATTVVGNNAGPPSLYIAALQSYATWQFPILAKAATGTYTHDVAETFYDLSRTMTDLLPEKAAGGVALRNTIRDVMEDAYRQNLYGKATTPKTIAANAKVQDCLLYTSVTGW